jgi:hypothetical protein
VTLRHLDEENHHSPEKSRKGGRATVIMDDVSNSNSKYIGNGVSIELW